MARKDRDRAEQRRTTKEMQRREATRRHRRQRLRNWSIAGAVVVVAIAVLARGGLFGPQAAAFLGRRIEPPPGERISTLPGNLHIAAGTRGTGYTSNPPTSGEHYPNWAPWGVHTQSLPDELLVHNLEHGGIWISYKDPRDTELARNLEALAGRYPTKVIVTPRPQNDAPIAVAAWGRLLKLQQYDEQQIMKFVEAYRGKIGPEPQGP